MQIGQVVLMITSLRVITLFFFCHTSILWKLSKQSIVVRSSTKGEYKAFVEDIVKVIWLQCLLTNLHIPSASTFTIWCDNLDATYLFVNPIFHARTKHVEVVYHFV